MISLFTAPLACLGDLLFPPNCPTCGRLCRTKTRGICATCQESMEPLAPPLCPRCGQPWAGASVCPSCQAHPQPCRIIRSPLIYGGVTQQAILCWKLGGVRSLSDFFAEQIASAPLDGLCFEELDALVPVPLHPGKLAERGFNQAHSLARALSRQTGLPVWPYQLRRKRATSGQSRMQNPRERGGNVKNAFVVSSPRRFAGKTLCLVDDVVTTGSTLSACATTLLGAGAEAVVAVTVARTLLN